MSSTSRCGPALAVRSPRSVGRRRVLPRPGPGEYAGPERPPHPWEVASARRRVLPDRRRRASPDEVGKRNTEGVGDEEQVVEVGDAGAVLVPVDGLVVAADALA